MSIETWKEEFYPVTAEAVNAGGSASVGELIEHSLRKWRGATYTNLERHGLERHPDDNITLLENDEEVFCFDIHSCSLCQRFNMGKRCVGCPLVDEFGNSCCEYKRGYYVFAEAGKGPDLMIHELEEALEEWREENV